MKTSKAPHKHKNSAPFPAIPSAFTVITISTLASLTNYVVDSTRTGVADFLMTLVWSLVATGMLAATVAQWIGFAREVNPPAEAPEGERPSL